MPPTADAKVDGIKSAVDAAEEEDVIVNPTRAAAEIQPWVEPAARLGHAAKGAVFLLTGAFALAAQLTPGRDADGVEGALAALRAAPLGKGVLILIAIGLVYYAGWELYRAVADPEHEARRALLRRGEWLVTGTIFALLALAAFQIAFGHASAGDDDAARKSAWTVMSALPHGAMLLAGVGVVIIVAGLVQIRRGWRADLERNLDLSELPPRGWYAIYGIARFGTMARGFVITIIGTFTLLAGWTHDPAEAVGFAGVFRALDHQSYGAWLLDGVVLGLVSYGVYELLIAWKGRFYVR